MIVVAQLVQRMGYAPQVTDASWIDVVDCIARRKVEASFCKVMLESISERPALQSKVASRLTLCGDWSAASIVSHADDYVETLRSALSADSLRLLSMIHASRSTPNVAAWEAALLLVTQAAAGEPSLSLVLPTSVAVKFVTEGAR